jgi:hemolysin III
MQSRGEELANSLSHGFGSSSVIFLLIAGTYTPFTLGVLRGTWGWSLLGLVWGIAVTGVVLKALNRLTHPILTTSLYLLMGWLIVIAAEPLSERVPAAGLLWLVAGGLAYTLGVIFFALDSRLRYGHFIWHLFVMAGTACHYFAVLGYAA